MGGEVRHNHGPSMVCPAWCPRNLAARLAVVEALADEWTAGCPGAPKCRTCKGGRLRAALGGAAAGEAGE